MSAIPHKAGLVLSLCPDLPARTALELIAACGSAAAVLAEDRSRLLAAGLSAAAIDFLRAPEGAGLTAAADWLAAPGRHLIDLDDPAYPPLLIESGEPPLCLFVAGDPAILSLPQIAIVGSRKATPGGRETAREFAGFLGSAGFTITSGLAEGVDAEAHAGAIAGGGNTVAVMGTGPDEIYPRANARLGGILPQHGALVTEFVPGTPPRRENFPQRNRIIAGLSLGVLVVEAGIRSGSLITARYAGNYGREIFAIPGSIHNPMSKGCHRLIKQGAKLVESADDIVAELASLTGTLAAPAQSPAAETGKSAATDPEYTQLLDSMGYDPITIDRLADRSGLTAEQLSSMLLILELEGKVNSVPGGYFQQLKGVN